ncbi:alpha-L-fucosidase [Lederbergia citrea]|uniref:alpha-L-fucosidase n=1 Tax=Lederbergia citrea TaxID=2833581 RepID=UPI001BCA4033|nr:alpha-L-fucosidase [Lederbergia citrea]MBS4179389.1 alpha-L-fucosidase [Lederbergia citrea]
MDNHKYQPNWDSLDSRIIPEWFQNAKFGIFIHWGVYSVPSWRKLSDERFGSYAEWYYASVYGNYKNYGDDFHKRIYGEGFEYRDFASSFTAELFDANFWAKTFKNAGAKYVVLTSKHHDGYCLWPTENKHKENWRVTDVGPKVDLLGKLTDAVKEQGMKMGVYYSIIDWETNKSHRPESGYFVPESDRQKYGIDEEKYPEEILIPQLKELVTKYQPSLIFSDGGEWDLDENISQTKEFLSWLYNEAPNKDEVVVNDRFCVEMPGKHGDYFSSEYEDVDHSNQGHVWEESRGIGGSYGFNRAESLENYSTSEQLIHELTSIVSRGGNLLLNVGPTWDGRIPVIQQLRLKDIGDWLKVNGEAIFETRPYNGMNHTTNKFTTNNNNIYCIMDAWPDEKEIFTLSKSIKIDSIQLLGLDSKLEYEMKSNKLIIKTPLVHPNKLPCQYSYVFKIKLTV